MEELKLAWASEAAKRGSGHRMEPARFLRLVVMVVLYGLTEAARGRG